MDTSAGSPMTSARTIGVVMSPLSLRVAQAVGLTTSAWLAAQTTSLSALSTPALLLSPAPVLLAQWATLARLTHPTASLLRFLASTIFTYLATRQPSTRTATFKLYATAAVLLPLTVPYALLFARGAATELSARATAAAASPDPAAAVDAHESALARDQKRKARFPAEFASHSFPQFFSTHVSPGIAWPFFESGGVTRPANAELSAHQLLDKWAWVNLGAGAITAAGAGVATWAVVCEGLGVLELF